MSALNPISALRWLRCILLLALLLTSGCKKKPAVLPPTPALVETPSPPAPSATPTPSLTPPLPEKHTPLTAVTSRIDGTLALQRARTICSLGSRAYGTPGYRQTLAWLRSELTRLGWHTVYQAFDTTTPVGPRTYTNLIATWPIDKDNPKPSPASNRLILTSHYDSRGSEFGIFPAASSGAAGCGIILELAERLAAAPDLAARVEFVFFDGEEPTRQISTTDGLCGSRFFLHSLEENGQATSVRALLAFGAVGHTGAKWTMPTLTNSVLNQTLQTFIYLQKWGSQITPLARPSWGPHLPALQAGVPATFLNDALYPALGTADDTPESLNAESLRRAALASLQLLQLPPQAATPATKSN